MSQFVENSQDHRYSRQSYTIGQDAQTKLSNASVLVIGYNTLSQEIIRNMALIGVSKIDIFASKKILGQNHSTTGLYYPIKDNSIPLDDLRKLNPTIKIDLVDIMDEDNELDKKKIVGKYNLVILTNSIIDDAIDINRLTHKFNIPFVMCGSYGLMGYVFNDWGENFTITDLDGETSEPLILESVDDKILKFKDEHKLSQSDTIIVSRPDGSETEFVVHRKKSPLIVELNLTPFQDKLEYSKILRKKISQTFNFETLKKNIDNPSHTIGDWSVGLNRSELLHKLHLGVSKYLNEFGELPKAWSIPDWELFKFTGELNLSDADMMLARKFCFTLRGDLLPICSIIGGIVSHEVLKVLSHKYIPITQWYYMDYLDLIGDEEITTHTDYTCRNYKTKTKYDGLVNIFGKRFLETIQNTVPFVIGSGAIGCELVKNLGMMGVKKIYLTDPDHIEKSNLSRQFLFSDNDLRQSKSETAAKKIKLMNPDVEVISLKQKMCSDTEDYFDDKFHSGIDIYLNALDNVDARIYMDTQAIKYSKPLIDSGTMGSKGNVQVIIPNLTETYGSSKDPDEKVGIPICTLKAFPYKPEHTIQWARELFETEFNQIPQFLNKYKNKIELANINDADSRQLLKQLHKYENFEINYQSFNKLIGTILRENFFDNIKEIIDKYSKPENKEELGDKKLPEFLTNDEDDKQIIKQFYKNGFMLLNQVFGSNIEFDEKNNIDINIFDFIPFKYNIEELNSDQIIEILNPIIDFVPQASLIEFEKDDDDLGHVQWIWSCSNMRNIQYSIPYSNLWETRKIAGNIIPALITTTSLISGFQILEFIRVVKLYKSSKYVKTENKTDIDLYKNRFVNLNTNYLDGINPSPIQVYKLGDGGDNFNLSVWTNFKTSSLNTEQIISQIELETKKKIEFMTHGNKTIYDGDDISINIIDTNDKSNILVLLEDVPIGIPVLVCGNSTN